MRIGSRKKLRSPIWILIALLAIVATTAAQQIITGDDLDGSHYKFVIPNQWNHQLVVYAHGIVDPQAPVALQEDESFLALRDALVGQGFAVGYSSYAANGFAIKEGVRDTYDLSAIFARQVARPSRTYVMGVSLGGMVALDLAEKYPKTYDGALPMCGLIGGSPLEVEYVGNGRVLFDYFFPGVIPGTLLHTDLLPYNPGDLPLDNVGNAVYAALVAGLDPTIGSPTMQFANVAGIEAESPAEVVAGALYLLGFDVRYLNDLLARTDGQSPYTNRFIYYRGSLNDRALNAGVERVMAQPEGIEYLFLYYQPNGHLRIPTVTLHTTRDPLVPFWHEAVYSFIARAGGGSSHLVQQSVTRFGHCEFKPQEVLGAFQGLYGWVNYGIKPAGGDVTVQ